MSEHVHHVEWTDEKIRQFWDQVSGTDVFKNEYFSQQVGQGVVKFLRRTIPLHGRLLDYGCGPGYLVDHLLKAGIACEGMDLSPESVQAANAKFESHPLWRGAVTVQNAKVQDASLDGIICLEMIEHATTEGLARLLGEFRRMIKPDTGRLFITTPNDENLAASQVVCPDCGGMFHRVQHIHSFTADSLARLLEGHGFVTEQCDATDFWRFQGSLWPGLPDLSLRRLARMAWSGGCSLLDLVSPKYPHRWVSQYVGKGKNLFWIGTRKR